MEHQVLQFIVWRQGRRIVVGQAELSPNGELKGNIDVSVLRGEIESQVQVTIHNLVIHEKNYDPTNLELKRIEAHGDYIPYPKFKTAEPLPKRIPGEFMDLQGYPVED